MFLTRFLQQIELILAVNCYKAAFQHLLTPFRLRQCAVWSCEFILSVYVATLKLRTFKLSICFAADSWWQWHHTYAASCHRGVE